MLFDRALSYKSTSLKGKNTLSGKVFRAFFCPANRSFTVVIFSCASTWAKAVGSLSVQQPVSDLEPPPLQPLLDVLLFTRSMASIMGYQNQFILYGYYICSALLLRAMSPPLALMTAQETGLSGAFRSAHQVSYRI